MQIQAGGWFSGQKHTLESKQKISKKASNMNNGNCSGLTEDDYIIHGLKFCNDFDFIISRSKWKYYCKKKSSDPVPQVHDRTRSLCGALCSPAACRGRI